MLETNCAYTTTNAILELNSVRSCFHLWKENFFLMLLVSVKKFAQLFKWIYKVKRILRYHSFSTASPVQAGGCQLWNFVCLFVDFHQWRISCLLQGTNFSCLPLWRNHRAAELKQHIAMVKRTQIATFLALGRFFTSLTSVFSVRWDYNSAYFRAAVRIK